MLTRVQAVLLTLTLAAGVFAQSECPRTVTDYYSTFTFLYPCCTTTTTLDQVWVVVYPTTTSLAARALEPRESPCTLPTVTTSEISYTAAPNPSSTWTVTAYTSTFLYPCCTTTNTLDQVTTNTSTSWVVVYPTTTALAGRSLEPHGSCTFPSVTSSYLFVNYGPNPSSTWTVTACTSSVTATPPVTSTSTVSHLE
ncbi:hypothetical protein DL93DRAFT_352643 [Clavulina sp. PMI_390]|nr:hypothetical protein DL93DRAFT_352643 [Clavulina sp. PMI_390]